MPINRKVTILIIYTYCNFFNRNTPKMLPTRETGIHIGINQSDPAITGRYGVSPMKAIW
jgi:hypothetical protein